MTNKTTLDHYIEAINKIDDYFEYSNESVKDRAKVHKILKELTDSLGSKEKEDTNTLKPFYVSCEELTAHQANKLERLAIEAGANKHDSLEDALLMLHDDRFIGVDCDGETYYFAGTGSPRCYYGEDARHMTYEGAIEYLEGIVSNKEEEDSVGSVTPSYKESVTCDDAVKFLRNVRSKL